MTLIVRPQSHADRANVQDVIAAAFAVAGSTGAPAEVALNDALSRDSSLVPGLTLVAELDGRVVGQLTSSYGTLTALDGAQQSVVGVGPVAVLPDHQRSGVGSALLRSLLTLAETAGEPALVLLGDPGFYGRFGFVAAAGAGITAPDPLWGRHFQAHLLRSAAGSVAGAYRYSAPFDRL